MKIGYPGAARLEWYDRNPISRGIYYNAINIAPHGTTTRASYTVPEGKKAMVGGAALQIYRSAAPTTLGLVRATCYCGANIPLRARHYNATVGSIEHKELYWGGVLLATEEASIHTNDDSTGGTMDYELIICIMEFSA